MTDTRAAFIDAATAAAVLLARAEVAAHWDEPSALAEFSVAGLAGHLLRGITTTETYLDVPEPDADPITAAAYYVAMAPPSDLGDPVQVSIRARGEESAAGGPAAVAAEARAAVDRVRARLQDEPAGRKVEVGGGNVLVLDEYLATRIVELAVHADDLAVSVAVEPPLVPTAASVAIDTLIDVARLRSGDVAVLRALSRRERDPHDVLRVF